MKIRFFRTGPNGRLFGVEDTPARLVGYRAAESIGTGLAGLRIGKGSVMMLSAATAAQAVTAGHLEELSELNLKNFPTDKRVSPGGPAKVKWNS